jgi:hypothetical protein
MLERLTNAEPAAEPAAAAKSFQTQMREKLRAEASTLFLRHTCDITMSVAREP